jgi:hypothetical protein
LLPDWVVACGLFCLIPLTFAFWSFGTSAHTKCNSPWPWCWIGTWQAHAQTDWSPHAPRLFLLVSPVALHCAGRRRAIVTSMNRGGAICRWRGKSRPTIVEAKIGRRLACSTRDSLVYSEACQPICMLIDNGKY